MTNEIEKEFFDAFGIKPKKSEISCNECGSIMEECGCFDCEKEIYPEITDRILLELIVINNENAPAVGDTLEELKNQILYWCIQYKCKIYNQVRELFGINSAQVGQLK